MLTANVFRSHTQRTDGKKKKKKEPHNCVKNKTREKHAVKSYIIII